MVQPDSVVAAKGELEGAADPESLQTTQENQETPQMHLSFDRQRHQYPRFLDPVAEPRYAIAKFEQDQPRLSEDGEGSSVDRA